MQITKAIFETIRPGEIFWVVTTSLLSAPDSKTTLTFVCVKGKEGKDWFIRSSLGSAQPDDIARYGDELQDLEKVQCLFPCNDELLALYRK